LAVQEMLDVAFWHFAHIEVLPPHVCFQGNGGHRDYDRI
jgi:hypothetical protein